MSILDELPEHLAIVAELRRDPSLCLLAGLKSTEIELVYDAYRGNDKERIDDWMAIFDEAGTHCGDCINLPITCLLCEVICAFSNVKHHLNQDNSNEEVLKLIEVMLGTESDMAPVPGCNIEEVEEFFNYQCDMVKRRKAWAEKTDEERKKVKERMEKMIEYMKVLSKRY